MRLGYSTLERNDFPKPHRYSQDVAAVVVIVVVRIIIPLKSSF